MHCFYHVCMNVCDSWVFKDSFVSIKLLSIYVVGCLNSMPHNCLPLLSLRKPVGKGVASPHFVCVFEILGEGGTISIFCLWRGSLAIFSIFTKHGHWGETWCANVHVRASKMEDRKSGAQTRCHFSHLTLIFRLEIDIQESSCLEWIHAISNLTGSVLYSCWAACEIWRKMRERTWYDALTYIASKQRMRERTSRCANERFLVPTNEHRLLASQRYHL